MLIIDILIRLKHEIGRDYTESVAKEDSMWKGETTNRQNIEGGRWVTFSRTKLPKGHNTISKETRTRE